ncbi:MAG: hypothetical protein NZM31_13410 [Gemmatales bacterium]|nr:hypothetical protein [Gemmatales bacterium]MDW8387995.1 hypothetical protein [Gemmatales bacterium]
MGSFARIMTVLGKVMVFVTLVVSLTGLGVALWVAVDYRDWKGEWDALNREITQLEIARQREEIALRDLLIEIKSGQRKMPWNPQTLLGAGDPSAEPPTVAALRKQIQDLVAENQRKLDEANSLQTRLLSAIDLVTKARQETEAAQVEQARLREEITPDPAKDPTKRPFKVLIEEQRVNQRRALEESGRYRAGVKEDPENYPGEINELVNLAQLRKRNAELKQRLAELKGATGTAASAR